MAARARQSRFLPGACHSGLWITVMMTRRFFTLGFSALLLGALCVPRPAASASRSRSSRRSGNSYRTQSRLRSQRDHHRGRSFGERRSRLRNPSYLRRDVRRRALSERANRRSPALSDVPGLQSSQDGASCRTMTSVEEIEGRKALISQRECIDASGLTRVSPGSRRVVRFYDE